MKRLTLLAGGLGALWAVRSVVRRLRALELENKVVLITGGSRGLGLVLARQLVARGAHVAICARDVAELSRAHEDLVVHAAGRASVLAVPCDITDRAEIAQLVVTVRDELGPIDVLINNAGVIQVGPMQLMTPADYELAMRTHFWAPLYLTLAVLPEMRARHAGRIVNIASIGGKIAVPHLLPYTASKFALVGLSAGLRAELAQDGVCVTTIVPGLMRTGSAINALFKGRHRDEYTWFALGDATPLTAMNAERAARQIIRAMCLGEAEVTLSIQAKLAARVYGLAPGLVQDALALVDRLLPGIGGIGPASARGRDSESRLAPSLLTRLADLASIHNNEI